MAMRRMGLAQLIDNKRIVTLNIVLIANAFIWYSYGFKALTSTISNVHLESQFLELISIHFLSLFLAVIIGEFISYKIKQTLKFLKWWMAIGILLSTLPLLAYAQTYIGILVLSVITGANFGFGIPACLGYFGASIEPSNRGKLGGIIFLLIGIGFFLIGNFGTETFLIISIVLTVWRAIGFFTILAINPVETLKTEKQISYSYIISNKPFLLYFVPWTLFLIINSLAFPVIGKQFDPELIRTSSNIEFVLGGISAVVFGFLADTMGRKRLAVAGFALLGLGYGILGFSAGNNLGWWFYTFVDGIAWGCFAMIFVFTLWGDLAEGRRSERIYAVGILPYLISTFIRYFFGNLIADAILDFSMIVSFASFFLFIAVLPLVLAPETLSEQTIKNKELQKYIEKANKQVNKAKNKKEAEGEQSEKETDKEEKSEEYDEARKLAEKYY